jgi:hypothetical protein
MLTMEPGPALRDTMIGKSPSSKKGARLDRPDPSIPAKPLINPLPARTLSVQQVG